MTSVFDIETIIGSDTLLERVLRTTYITEELRRRFLGQTVKFFHRIFDIKKIYFYLLFSQYSPVENWRKTFLYVLK